MCLLSSELLEDLNSLLHEVAHDQLVALEYVLDAFSLGRAHGLTLSLVLVSGDCIVAVEEGLVGFHEFLEHGFARVHLFLINYIIINRMTLMS